MSQFLKESRSYCALKTTENNEEETKSNMQRYQAPNSQSNSIPMSARGRSSSRSPFRNVSQEQYDIVNDETNESEKNDRPIQEIRTERHEPQKRKNCGLDNYSSTASRKKKT